LDTEKIAVPAPSSGEDPSCIPPSKKATLPEGAPEVTVNVTLRVIVDAFVLGFIEEVSRV
jgi:hypothetical protein